MFQKRHYEALARAVRGFCDEMSLNQSARLRLADRLLFEDNNPRFDRARFLKACGVEQS